MLTRSQALQAVNKLISKQASEDEQFGLLRSFILGPDFPDLPKLNHDHTAVLVSASMLENGLARAIARKLVPMDASDHNLLFGDSGNGPLASFASKIRLGHALGMYGLKMREDLVTIKSIRNVFAHSSAHTDFETNEIADACNTLSVLDRNIWGGLRPKPQTARGQYLASIELYYLCLTWPDPADDDDLAVYWRDFAFWPSASPRISEQPPNRDP
jgi:hypothetical protein